MFIDGIDESVLVDSGRLVSVAIIDSGFSRLPPYAVLHSQNHVAGTEHGNRILSIFTALDDRRPLGGLSLHLSCYVPSSGYDGLAKALRCLPDCDILSISMSWRDDIDEIRELMKGKFRIVCVPFSADSSLRFPSCYDFTTTCSNMPDDRADYCIRPNVEWHGNSYAVPAIARLLAYGVPIGDVVGNTGVGEAFSSCRSGVVVRETPSEAGVMTCGNCHRCMRSPRTHGLVTLEHGAPCPYCGHPL